jgi:drug/metabolite transporter (DMT)-like permease
MALDIPPAGRILEKMQQPSHRKLPAVASLAAAMVSFGVIPIFLSYFAQFLDAWTVNGVRYSVGALFWLPFLLFLEREAGPGQSLGAGRNVWRDAAVPSLVNIVGQACFGLSVYYVKPSTIGFALRLSFLFTIFFGFWVLAEERRLARSRLFWLGTAASLAGVAAMFAENLEAGDARSLEGMAILVVTTLSWGGYSVSVRRWMAPYSARQSFGVISIYTSLALVGLMFLWGEPGRLAGIGPGLWLTIMISALIGIAFGHVLYYQGIHRLGPVVSSGIMLVTPFVTHLTAAVVLDERLTELEWLGGLLVVVGGGVLVAARATVEKAALAALSEVDDQGGG